MTGQQGFTNYFLQNSLVCNGHISGVQKGLFHPIIKYSAFVIKWDKNGKCHGMCRQNKKSALHILSLVSLWQKVKQPSLQPFEYYILFRPLSRSSSFLPVPNTEVLRCFF